MQSSEIMRASQVIGKGLEAQNCQLELKPFQGNGFFWQHQNAAAGVGIWCSQKDWEKAVLDNTGISILDKLPEDFIPCIGAAVFEIVGSWIVESVSETPEPMVLEENIYPILTLSGVRCVLINWPIEEWQPMVSHWAPCSGDSPDINMSLIAGYRPQQNSIPEFPEIGAGMWLDQSADVEEGQAILWWQRPLARVTIKGSVESGSIDISIDEILNDVTFSHPPLLAELATAQVNLADIGIMMEGDEFPIRMTNNSDIRLCRQLDEVHQETLGTVSLLRSPSGLIAKIESKAN
ncbi:MAG: hypothetical protein ACPGUD_03375 [Parashewanella sp.]